MQLASLKLHIKINTIMACVLITACQAGSDNEADINNLVEQNPLNSLDDLDNVDLPDVNIPDTEQLEDELDLGDSIDQIDNVELVTGCVVSEEAQEILDAHNVARATARTCGDEQYAAVLPLSWDCTLEDSSLGHSLDMAEFNFFNHTGSDGLSPFDRIRNAGYVYRSAGENIAAGQPDVPTVMDAWLNSPGHCANIMSPSFTEMGAATVIDTSTFYRIYWTVNFGRPF